MRLTKQMKSNIVNRILKDTPCVDYESEIESLCQADAISSLPYELKKLIAADRNKFLPYLRQEYYRSPYICAVSNIDGQPTQAFRENIELLRTEKKEDQRQHRQMLTTELIGLFSCVNTDKPFRKVFPEFEKYLPEVEKVKHLPVSNTIKRLVDAGWRQDDK